jgi:class 3 adenylate cyclase
VVTDPEIPETRYATNRDVHIAYQVVGEGPLDLLFARGSPQVPIDLVWEEPTARRFLGRLSSFSRLVLFDTRGWGSSAAGASGTVATVEDWADDFGLVMDAVGLERAAVVGASIGGFVSMFFAAAHPERVSRLVLINAFARFLRDDNYSAGAPAEVLESMNKVALERYGTGESVDWFAPSVAGDLRFRRWWGRCERLANGPVAATAYWDDLATRDLRPILPALRVPTLVLHRRGDRFIRVDHGRYLAASIPGAAYVELDGEDHFYFVGDVDAVLDETEEFLTGQRGGHDPDRMLASVLFTDIVDSTGIAARIGDRCWRVLLDRHDELVRSAVERFRGRVVKLTGDGVLATFDGPARAIRCACALRDEVRAIGLELRAGLHTGEIERRGDDVGGIAVHLAARVKSFAKPGEVVVSRTVTDLVAGSGIEFDDRGEHELKGVPGSWKLFAVRA